MEGLIFLKRMQNLANEVKNVEPVKKSLAFRKRLDTENNYLIWGTKSAAGAENQNLSY